MSLAGFTEDDRPHNFLLDEIREFARAHRVNGLPEPVFVAAAGNGSTCRPAWPAAHAEVLGVGALDSDRRAWFSNFGSWVGACAPGVMVHSTFFLPKGRERVFNNVITGYAKWSGTSFSAPKVAAAVVDVMVRDGVDATTALEKLSTAPDLLRVPDQGVVVNLA